MNFTLHGKENGKFFNAEQAKYVNHFKNIKEGLYKTNESIWYKKICRHLDKGKQTNHQCLNTVKTAT